MGGTNQSEPRRGHQLCNRWVRLGQQKSEPSAELLIVWLDTLAWDNDIELAMWALSLHRSEWARQCLLEHVAGDSRARARVAVTALATHRYDRQLSKRVREAAQRSPDSALVVLVDELYAVPTE